MTEPITCIDVERGGTRLSVQWFEETPPTVPKERCIQVHFRRTWLDGQREEHTEWMTPKWARRLKGGLGTALDECEACCEPVEEVDDESVQAPPFVNLTEGYAP